MHTERAGKQYANIASVSPMPKGMTAPELSAPPLAFDIDAPDAPAILGTLSDGLQATITASPEWQSRMTHGETPPPTGGDAFADFPDDLVF